ncbi:MAG TPA: tRNA adenosine deaminase-associated protein [Mycobacteriales bacterium]|nr:tRNA adenosine deaminase-associated protein [Mycobacteriales bacterium]
MADFAVVVSRVEGLWEAELLPERLVEDFPGLLAALRQQVPGDGGVIGLVNVADEFFVAVRVVGQETRVLLSDVTAAVAWDLAAEVVDWLGIERPGDDDLDDVWPAGDLSIFSDLGLDEMELGALLSDLDAYADETLLLLARRLGFADAYERVVEPVFH